MGSTNTESSVKVVVRIRPQMHSEKVEMCQVCTHVLPELNQISLGEGRSFTFDNVCDIESSQAKVYELCALELIHGLFDGYNATLIAYGQTGSGKTYTMGTSFDLNIEHLNVGIIPRAMDQLFGSIEDRKKKNEEAGLPRPEFTVSAQFMELYNEEIFDLLNPSNDKTKKSGIKIHEDGNSNICVIGLNSYKCQSKEDAMECLKLGTLSRSTASTNMNVQSSRSHAVFSIFLHQKRYVKIKRQDEINNGRGNDGEEGDDVNEVIRQTSTSSNDNNAGDNDGDVVVEMLNAKFNFVDLAGSERLKRTGATGDRAKEGISINCGLLALGNVISALGDLTKIGCHVPYRDSKLTRILQDSLGGNSHTTMIACISPSDLDFMETLNTLKYANRARNIRNKVMANKDMTRDQLIQNLKAEVAALRGQLEDLKEGRHDGLSQSEMAVENKMLLVENRDLSGKVKALNLTVDDVTGRNVQLRIERDAAVMLKEINGSEVNENNEKIKDLIKTYVEESETFRSKFITAERHLTSLTSAAPMTHRSSDVMSRSMTCFPSDNSLALTNRSNNLINQARKDLENLTKIKSEREKSIKERIKFDRKISNNEPDNSTVVDDNDEDAGDDDDDEDDDASSVSSGSETEIENAENVDVDLADLSCEISIKQKLIDELIESQKKVRQLKQQYEDKISNLEEKIRITAQERDRVFQGISDKKGTKEESRKAKKEYEEKLNEMKEKLLKLNAAKQEHKKFMMSQGSFEKRLSTLQNELFELKKIKVRLMRQLEDESHRNRQNEQRMKRELATMQKQQRVKDVQLKNFEVEKKKRDNVLRRKIEEVEALKKKEKVMSDRRSAARRGRGAVSKKQKTLSWDRIEKMVEVSVKKKQTLRHLDRDMEKYMKHREILCKKLEQTTERMRQTEIKKEEAEMTDLMHEIDQIRESMNATQLSIHQCQKCIMNFEGNKDDDLEALIENCSLGDVMYYLERCTLFAINKGLMAVQKEEECKELQAKLEQEKLECQLNRETVEKLINDKVEVQAEHGALLPLSDEQDRSPTPPLYMVDSLEELQALQMLSKDSKHDVPNDARAVDNKAIVNIGDNGTNSLLISKDEAAPEDMSQGFITEADTPYSIPSVKLHLVHCKTALGHTKAVLSLQATKSKLYSSSKDATVKVWDLTTGVVISTFDEHPGSVVKVRFVEPSNLVFAASTYVIKVWDPRMRTCVATLTSSGSRIDQSLLSGGSPVSCPTGEMNVNNIASNCSGSLFLSSAGNSVRIWDIRTFKPISKLFGGHQSSITSMALIDTNQNTSLVATASKDNSIRVYSLGSKELSSGSSINSKMCLNSCHLDSIESLSFSGPSCLFSGSRDMTISKWDLSAGGQHRQSVQNAHRSWVISTLCTETDFQPNSSSSFSPTNQLQPLSTGGWLVTSCQSGTLRLWSSSNLTLLSEYKTAHQGAINSLAVGGLWGEEVVEDGGGCGGVVQVKKKHAMLFTASNDRTINIWRIKSEGEQE